jgi:uncharacterized membrane protein HdeD (DUF308 family)
MLDLRLPSGLFFAITGILLIVYGIVDPARAAMTSVNVNLYVGVAMTAFGLFLLVLAKRGRQA